MVTLYSQNTITNKTPETKPKTWTSIEKKKKNHTNSLLLWILWFKRSHQNTFSIDERQRENSVLVECFIPNAKVWEIKGM